MKAARQIINEQLGISLNADNLAPMDLAECERCMIEFAKMHVKLALKEALEEVPYGGSDEIHYEDVVGILTCYNLDNIK